MAGMVLHQEGASAAPVGLGPGGVADGRVRGDRPAVTTPNLRPGRAGGSYTELHQGAPEARGAVTVPAEIRPQSIYDAIRRGSAAATDNRTSPSTCRSPSGSCTSAAAPHGQRGHPESCSKFMVVDNPQKFALFKRIHKDGQGRAASSPRKLPFRTLAGRAWSLLSWRGWASRGAEPSLPWGVGSAERTFPCPSFAWLQEAHPWAFTS